MSLEIGVLGNFGTVLLLFVGLALQNEGVSDKGAIRNGLNLVESGMGIIEQLRGRSEDRDADGKPLCLKMSSLMASTRDRILNRGRQERTHRLTSRT